jgi:thioredoxin-related protein
MYGARIEGMPDWGGTVMDRRKFCHHMVGSAILVGSFSKLALADTALFGGTAGAKLKWQTNLKAAHKLAVQQDKPMMIVFGASWCTFCHKLERETLSDRQTVAFIEREFIPVHLDFDKERKIAKILEAESLPCTVILTPDADLLGRSIGYAEPKEYRATLTAALDKRTEIQQAANSTTKTSR